MGDWCYTKGFYKKEKYGDIFCLKCNIKVKKVKTEHQSNSTMTDRGRLNTTWDEITWKCPKCNRTGKEDAGYSESDGSYYSNEERRVYRI